MKFNKITLILFLFFITANTYAQEVIVNEVKYEVKNDTIFKDGVDVTNTLSAVEQEEIKRTFSEKLKEEKKLLKEEKRKEVERKNSEKKLKKEEKKRKKAEKKLKKQELAIKKLDKAKKKYKKSSEKFEKLKSKGKLSPEDELDWNKKLDKLKKDIERKKRKL